MRFSFVILLSFASIVWAIEEVQVTNFKIGALAKDQEPSSENLKQVPTFSKLSNNIKVDQFQRLYVSFDISKKADNSKIVPQQVFLRFEEYNTQKDVIFVVNPKSEKSYVFDNVLRSIAKHFRNLNGTFKASLVVGGPDLKNPINWSFANLDLDLPIVPEIVPNSQKIIYETLPEINHQFRQPEKRPSVFISDLFTIVCISPLVLLIGAWAKIGINFQNAPTSVWVPIFHVGLAGILSLYFLFWLQLNMFETLKYLAILGFVTFVAGNRVLRSLSSEKKKAE